MAKKPKIADPSESEETAADAPAAKGGGRKKLILFGALGLLVLGGGAGGYAYVARPKDDGVETAKAVKPAAFLDVREMVVNLAGEPNQERPRMLKFRAALEVRDAELLGAIKPLLPRVEDAFQVFVRELRVSDLEGSVGIYRLREELLRRVNVAVAPSKVDAVLFRDLILQ